VTTGKDKIAISSTKPLRARVMFGGRLDLAILSGPLAYLA